LGGNRLSERLSGVALEVDPRQFAHPTLTFLRDYWEAKRGSRAMPSRADIKPSELKEHLGWVTLVEVLPEFADFRYKLIGTLVTQYYLEDSTGKTVREAFGVWRSQAAVNGALAMFRKCARDCVVLRVHGDADWIAPGYEEFEAICLPLSDDGEHSNMVLHAFSFNREKVMLAREIARANSGRLMVAPPRRAR
jgi:hypothetical protein